MTAVARVIVDEADPSLLLMRRGRATWLGYAAVGASSDKIV